MILEKIDGLRMLKKEHKFKGTMFNYLKITGKIFRGEISGCTRSVLECVCICGNTTYARAERLINERTISCGCIKRKRPAYGRKKKKYIPVPAEKRKKPGRQVKTHDQYSYETYKSMKRRCKEKNHPSYHNYGGRGISVCEEWSSFKAFLNDMGPRPIGKELDRIDCDGGYSKENCRWVTHKENMQNTRRAKAKKIAQLESLAGMLG